MQYYTTIKQSKKLVELGLSPDTADMCWGVDFESNHYNCSPYPLPWKDYTCKEVYLPCWSLGALLEVMPKIQEDDEDGGCCPVLCRSWDNSQWHCVYRTSIHITKWYDTSIEAAYNMVVWLLENGYIKKGE